MTARPAADPADYERVGVKGPSGERMEADGESGDRPPGPQRTHILDPSALRPPTRR